MGKAYSNCWWAVAKVAEVKAIMMAISCGTAPAGERSDPFRGR
jgi:hypothetical protein